MTTILEPYLGLYKIPLSNDLLLTTATNIGTRGWSLYTGLTVYKSFYKSTLFMTRRTNFNVNGMLKHLLNKHVLFGTAHATCTRELCIRPHAASLMQKQENHILHYL